MKNLLMALLLFPVLSFAQTPAEEIMVSVVDDAEFYSVIEVLAHEMFVVVSHNVELEKMMTAYANSMEDSIEKTALLNSIKEIRGTHRELSSYVPAYLEEQWVGTIAEDPTSATVLVNGAYRVARDASAVAAQDIHDLKQSLESN